MTVLCRELSAEYREPNSVRWNSYCSALQVPAVEVSSESFMAHWGSTEDQEPNGVK